jgi:hypothetical protein
MSVMKQHGKRRNMDDTSNTSPVFQQKLKSSSFEDLVSAVSTKNASYLNT